MKRLNIFAKNKNRKSKSNSQPPQVETFILEPILTPSGIVDSDDRDSNDLLATDFDLTEFPDIDYSESNNLESQHALEIKNDLEYNDSNDLTEIDFINQNQEENQIILKGDLDTSISDGDLEALPFIQATSTKESNFSNLFPTENPSQSEAISLTSDGSLVNIDNDLSTEISDVDESDTELKENSFLVQDSNSYQVENVTQNGYNETDINEISSEQIKLNQSTKLVEENVNLKSDIPEISLNESTKIQQSEPLEVIEQTQLTELQINSSENISTDDSVQPITDNTLEAEDNLAESTVPQEVEIVADATLPQTNHLELEYSRFTSGVFTVGETGQVKIDYLFDGGNYQGELAIFSLKGMEKFEPGSPDFIKEAAHRALSNSELGYVVISDPTEGAKFTSSTNAGNYLGTKEFNMRPGDEFGVMLVPNGSLQQVFNNPNVGGALRPLFSLVTANPNQGFHVGQIADVTGDGHTFVLEDLRVDGNTDRDCNDVIFQVRGATGKAINLDQVIAPGKDWRTSKIGQELVTYAEANVASDPVVPDLVSDLDRIKLADDGKITNLDDTPSSNVIETEVFSEKEVDLDNSTGLSNKGIISSDITDTTTEDPTLDLSAIASTTETVNDTSTINIADSDRDAIKSNVEATGNIPTSDQSADLTVEVTHIDPISTNTEDASISNNIASISTAEVTNSPVNSTAIGDVLTSNDAALPTGKMLHPDIIIIADKNIVELDDIAVTTPQLTHLDVPSVAVPENNPISDLEITDVQDIFISNKTEVSTPEVINSDTTNSVSEDIATSDAIQVTQKDITNITVNETDNTEIVVQIQSLHQSDPSLTSVPNDPVILVKNSEVATTESQSISETFDNSVLGTTSEAAHSEISNITDANNSSSSSVNVLDIQNTATNQTPISPATTVTEVVLPASSKEATASVESIPVTTNVEGGASENSTSILNENQTVQEHTVAVEVIATHLPLAKPELSGIFTVDSSGKVSVDYLYDGGYYQGDLAIFSLKGMEHLQPGSEAFIQEAARRALSSSELGHIVISDALEGARFNGKLGERDWNAGTYQGVKTVNMTPGDEFAVMLVPNGKVQQVFDNPKIGGAKSPLFSISSGDGISQMVDVTGKGHTFAFEDLRIDGNSDRDYNDIIFQVKGATGKAQHFEEAVAPGKDWRNSLLGKELLAFAANADIKIDIAHPVSDITLTATQPTNTVDLSQVFSHPNPDKLQFEIIAGNSASLQVQLDANQLYLTGLPKTGVTDVAIRAFDDAGNAVIHSFTVSTSTLSQESTQAVNAALTQLADALAQNPADLVDGLDSEAGEIALSQLESIIQEYPDILRLVNKPQTLLQLGISNAGVNTLQQFLSSKEIAEEFGLRVSLGEALSNPDRTFLDSYLINADEAVDLLPSDAKQPKVGFLDFRGEHTQRVTESFASVNPLAKFDTLPISNGNWAEQLVKFVDKVRLSGENHGIVNLSFDLSQLDDIGVTTRYELTPAERDAIAYAQQHNILLVVAAGNTGDKMSALGAAAEQFDNIITVGAVNQLEERADYSAMGNGLSIVAPGGEWDDEPNAFVGTSRATPYVTAAASLIWAANSGLSYQQVKDLLLDTAVDLNTPGWDSETGAGLLDVKEAVSRAQLIEPQKPGFSEKPGFWEPFSGEGRVKILERAASEGTKKAIESLENTQESLLEQWQVLADLGNPNLSLEELRSTLSEKTNSAFDKYQQATTDAAISTAKAQQLAEALALATSHYQIEQSRLQDLEIQKQALEENLANLSQNKTALEAEKKELIDRIEAQIKQTKKDLAAAQAKLQYIDPKVLELIRQMASQKQQQAQSYRQEAKVFEEQKRNYEQLASQVKIQMIRQVIGYEKPRSGKSREIWGLVPDPKQVALKNQYLAQAKLAEQNRVAREQIAQQIKQQAADLNETATALETQGNNLETTPNLKESLIQILQFLQQQSTQQHQVAQSNRQQAKAAEQRQQQAQNQANWHNSQIRQWQVIGTKKDRSGKPQNVWGWVEHPEHIALYDRYQQQATQAEKERQGYESLAQQAEQQAAIFTQQAQVIQKRIDTLPDWPVLKQGIIYEINADKLRLQAEQDLQSMHEKVQQQEIEKLNLQISQAQSELKKLVSEKLPKQTIATTDTENRLNAIQSELATMQSARITAQKNLQNFLETSGFLLPNRERLAGIEKNIQQIEAEQVKVEETILQLTQQLALNPNDILRAALDRAKNYRDSLADELEWAKLQQDRLNISIPDSPERLAIAAAIADLEKAKGSAIANDMPLQRYIDFLHQIEGGGGNFLQGFDNLGDRLNKAKTEQIDGEKALSQLQEEYRNLGLAESDLKNNRIPAKQQQIDAKDAEIAATKDAIAQTQITINNLGTQLFDLEGDRAEKAAEFEKQQNVVSFTQSQLADLQSKIATNYTEIQQQQSQLENYQNQINEANARVNQFEQRRKSNQNSANNWNKQISVFNEFAYLAYYEDVRNAVAVGLFRSGAEHYLSWGRFEGRLPNPQAKVNRDKYQAAANSAAKQRDIAKGEAQSLTDTLQPQIAANEQQIATLQLEQKSLTDRQQLLQTQLRTENDLVKSLDKQLQSISQQIDDLQSQIQQQNQQLDGLNTQLQSQQQQRDILANELAALTEQKQLLEQKLIDKYNEIELTDRYLSQVKSEVSRLQSRLDLLNEADNLQQEYQSQQDRWQQATQTQADATNTLLANRQASAADRTQLSFLQTQLVDTQTALENAEKQKADLEIYLPSLREGLKMTELQLKNQELNQKILIDGDVPLANSQTNFFRLAEAHRKKIWQWNGKKWVYYAKEEADYLHYLQQASLFADRRNQASAELKETEKRILELKQQKATQEFQITTQESQLDSLAQQIPQLNNQIASLQSAIAPIQTRLQPILEQEKSAQQAFQNAAAIVGEAGDNLAVTMQKQADALRRLIGFGMLASESDIEFFGTQIQPKVNSFIEQLQQRNQSFTAQTDKLNQLISSWEEQLTQTTDPVNQQALKDAIAGAKAQRTDLENWKQQNQTAVNELDELLQQAIASLTPLRQKQELEIREKLESNDKRLAALQSQLDSENVADAALKEDTVLAYAQLTDRVRQDLRDGATTWTKDFLAGNQKTKELGEQQNNLSNSVDDLITYIQNNLADAQGNYQRDKANLRDEISILGVLAPKADEYEQKVTFTDQAIAQIKQQIDLDDRLWQELAPIANRYGIESEEFQKYQQQYQDILAAKAPGLAKVETLRASAASLDKQAKVKLDRYKALNKQIAAIENLLPLPIRVLVNQTIQNNPQQIFSWYLSPYFPFIQQLNTLRQQADTAHQQYLTLSKRATALKNQAEALQEKVTDEADAFIKPLRDKFLEEHPENGTAIDLLKDVTLEGSNLNQQLNNLLDIDTNRLGKANVFLQAPAIEGSNPNQQLLDKAIASQASHEAQGNAALAQADWYAKQAAYHWNRSLKIGPTWDEWRGKEKITHVDQHWILWDTYRQYVPALREKGANHLAEAEKWRREKERLEPLVEQWSESNQAANQAELPIGEARDLLAVLEAKREYIPEVKTNLLSDESLLLTLKEQLEEALKEAQAANTKVQQEWTNYDSDSEKYRNAIADILQRRGELNRKAIETQQQLAESERWVENQSVELGTELQQVKALQNQLLQQRDAIAFQISVATGDARTELQTKLAQLEQSLQLITNKATVLTAQQTALTQKRILLTAQNEVILAEQRLLDAYIQDPDADYSNLQQQLEDARAALAEAQRLAKQAEAASKALTAPLQEVQAELLAQNDEHLKVAKEHQAILKALVEATESNANYTLQAAQKQQEINNLEFQILQRLQEATDAGSQEAKYLLEVARRNNIATAAEIYVRDYSDLASDKKKGGVARPEDQILVNLYFQEWLKNRELQRRAQAQVDKFRRAKNTAQSQMKTLQKQQETAAQLLKDLNAKVAETQAEREQKEQELAVAQARLDGITRIHEQTEQTFIQLVTLEKLNLAQAQLEQEIAQNRQTDIDAAVQARMERDRLELERQRRETTAKIEQLKQLQAEDDLRQSLNNVRGQLGLATLDATDDPLELQTKLDQLTDDLANLQNLDPDLPADVKAVLASVQGEIERAKQGNYTAVSQANLLDALSTLIIQGNQYKSEIDRIAQEDRNDLNLLETAQENLQQASQEFIEALDESKLLEQEREILTPLAMEALTKVAYANQAVNISKELASAAKDILKQIIDFRIKQRKERKKAFWMKVLSIAATVIGVVSMIVMPFAPWVGIGLGLVKGALDVIQSAIAGDWLGAIFKGVLAIANFVTKGLGQIIDKVGNCVCIAGKVISLDSIKKTIENLTGVASKTFVGIRSIISGDELKGALQILSGLASGISSQFGGWLNNLPFGDKILGVVNIISKTPVAILDSVRAIQSGDWFTGVNSLISQALLIGSELTGGVGDMIFGLLNNVNATVGAVVNNFIRGDGLKDWLNGIGEIAGAWKDLPKLIQGGIDEIEKDKCITGMEQILSKVLDSVKPFADIVGNGANAVENVTYTGLALITVIEGGTKSLKDLFKSSKEALGYLEKGWSDDIEKLKLGEMFKKLGKDLGVDLKAANGLDEKFDTLVNWAKTKLSPALGKAVIDLLNTLNPKTWKPQLVTP